MIVGIGIDIVELQRIERILERQLKFIDRILTPTEIEEFYPLSQTRRVEYVAGRFAVKEAYAKAKGTGFGEKLSFLDITVKKNPQGKPYIEEDVPYVTHVSISHSKEYAVAQVIIEKN